MTEFFQKNLGLTADFTGIYKSGSAAGITGNAHDHLFMFGPTYRIPAKHATIFAHALFGESHWSGTGDFLFGSSSATDNAFAMAFGGGVDYNIHKHIAVRVAQLDFVQTYHADTNQNNFRYSGGIVFKF
jgi:peptidoglycan-associated lipoprotein